MKNSILRNIALFNSSQINHPYSQFPYPRERICINTTSQWYKKNIAVLKRIYGKVEYDTKGHHWFYIIHFPLPEMFDQKMTLLFVKTPGDQINNHDGFSFYVNKGLTRPDMDSFEHIFENEGYNDLSDQKFARLSLHLKSFRPSLFSNDGDTLLGIIQIVFNFLSLRKGL